MAMVVKCYLCGADQVTKASFGLKCKRCEKNVKLKSFGGVNRVKVLFRGDVNECRAFLNRSRDLEFVRYVPK